MNLDTIICGDNAAVMATWPDACIDLVVTSPPYDDLRKYGGHSWDFPAVARELTRILKPGGVIVWVVGDATVDGSETLTSMKQAIHFRETCGLNVHDTMIFKKAGSGPNIPQPPARSPARRSTPLPPAGQKAGMAAISPSLRATVSRWSRHISRWPRWIGWQ